MHKLAQRVNRALRPGPLCRDCADHDGRCPTTGELCDPVEQANELSSEIDNALSRSPAGSLPTPEPTSMQRKKVQYLLDKGGKIAQPRLDVVMPDGSVASVDSHGRVYWQ